MRVLLLLVLLALAPPAVAADWIRPVPGDVVEAFDYDAGAPFAPGRHRGIDLAAAPGEPVRAPCSGRVSFAGRIPARGSGVTVRCGALAATLLHLRRVVVGRGAAVRRGRVVGLAGGAVQLGARRAAQRFAYVDPLALIGGEPVPLGPAPPPRERPRPRAPLPAARARRPQSAAPRAAMPPLAWAGLGLVVAGLPLGGVVRSRRRRRAARLRAQPAR